MNTITDHEIITTDKAGTIEITPTRMGEVRLHSDCYTVNTVDHRFSANASYRKGAGVWEVTYLGGERTPWRSANDFGFSRSVKRKLMTMIPEMLAREVTAESAELFVNAEQERRRIDEIVMTRQLVEAEAEVENLKLELRKLHRGDDYTPYPNN